jgi:hypothetical protein
VRRLSPIIAAVAILSLPAVAHAVPITTHEKMRVQKEIVDHELVRGDAFVTPKTIMVTRVVEDVIHVPPRDRDDDGIADKEDDCIGYCPPPEPVYAETSSAGTGGYSGTGLTDSAVSGYDMASCPASMFAESGTAGYDAYNPSSGATGCYQILPSTAAAHDCDLSTPVGQDACAAAICSTQGSAAWAASGASPC